jgi:hypothetical protein
MEKLCTCFYSKTNQMHNFRVYWISPYMFRTVFPSITRSSRLYTQHQVYVIQVSWLLASGHKVELISFSSETCRVIFNKLKNCASSWFCYRNVSRCTVPWTSNMHTYLLRTPRHLQFLRNLNFLQYCSSNPPYLFLKIRRQIVKSL